MQCGPTKAPQGVVAGRHRARRARGCSSIRIRVRAGALRGCPRVATPRLRRTSVGRAISSHHSIILCGSSPVGR